MSVLPARTARAGWLIAEWLPRLLVAALFLYTGATKIRDPKTFIKEVRAYEMVPLVLSNAVAYVLPWLEVFAALWLVSRWRREARLVLAGLLVAFTAAKGYLLVLGKKFDCGCVPTTSALHFLFDGWMGVVTNVVLLAFLAAEAWLEYRRKGRAQRLPPPFGQPESVPA